MARQPDVLSTTSEASVEVPWAEVEPIVGAGGASSAGRCGRGRVRRSAAELRHRVELLEQAAESSRRRAPERLTRERDRLRGAVAELLDGRQADETRVAQEIAFQADRLDITEELVRFRAHVAAVREALAADRVPRASSSASWRRSWGAR